MTLRLFKSMFANSSKYLVQLLTFNCIITIILGQNINDMGLNTLNKHSKIFRLPEEFVVESTIDSETYILGPGDKIGLSIITSTNLSYVMTITPTGDLWIPDVGAVYISGMNIHTAEAKVSQYIQENRFKLAEVIMVVLNIRNFKIQVIGAVINPGMITVSSVERLSDIIRKAGGLHKHADENNISISRTNKPNITCSLRSFQLDGDLINNPILNERNVINVPYLEEQVQDIKTSISYNQSLVFVTGFVLRPKGHKFISGLTVGDYIAMSGGMTDFGSENNILIYRNGVVFKWESIDRLKPGDQINIPANMKYRMLGNMSILQTLTAIMTLFLTYQAAIN